MVGNTCYKENILNKWLNLTIQNERIDSLFLTKNIEIENLIGSSSLDDENKLDIQIKELIDNTIEYFFQSDSNEINKLKEEDYYDANFKLFRR